MSTVETAAPPASDNREVRTIPHWFDGAERASTSGRTAPVYNPATGELSAHVALADEAEVAEAIASAERGFAVWGGWSIATRPAVMFTFRELLNARQEELGAVITAGHDRKRREKGKRV